MSEIRAKEFGRLTLRILRDQCIGTGACEKVVPGVLAFDERKIIDFTPEPPQVGSEALYEACEVCPVEALQLLDENGEQVAP